MSEGSCWSADVVGKKKMKDDDVVVSFSGLSCNYDEIIRRLKETISCSETKITRLEISDIELDVNLASCIVQLVQKNSGTITHLSLLDCSGHIDIVVTVSLMMNGILESLEIGTSELHVCAHNLGVGLLTSPNLKRLFLHSGKKRYFTLIADTAASLAKGLIGSKSLESLSLKRCRFRDSVAIQSICNALKLNSSLQHIVLQEFLSANGQTLPVDRYSPFLEALKDSQSLVSLGLSENQSHFGKIAEIIKGTSIRDLNMSSLPYDFDEAYEVFDLSLMVGALGGSRSLESLNLSWNLLGDDGMPYLAAALSTNTSIQRVDLDSSDIGNTGISILASKIPSMHGLKHLILTGNPFDGNAVNQLRRSLQLNYSIMHLDLDETLPHLASCMFYPDLNWMRRRFLFQEIVNPALWPLLLERANRIYEKPNGPERRANVVFSILQKTTVLFPL